MATDDTRAALASYPTPDWLVAMENDPELKEVENRPWANRANRAAAGCIGNDFVLHSPRLLFRFFWHQTRQCLEGAVIWTQDTEGPPKGAHGATVTTIFDEILAYPVWRSGVTAFTANLNINFRRMVPFASIARFIAYVDRVQGRKIYVRGRIFDPLDHKIVYAEAEGLWVQSDYLSSISVHGHEPSPSLPINYPPTPGTAAAAAATTIATSTSTSINPKPNPPNGTETGTHTPTSSSSRNRDRDRDKPGAGQRSVIKAAL